jgi:hypothetical protein
LVTLEAGSSNISSITLGSGGAIGTDLALDALDSLLALRASGTGRTDLAGQPLGTFGTDRPDLALDALWPRLSGGSRVTLYASGTSSSGVTLRASCAVYTSGAFHALDALVALGPSGTN